METRLVKNVPASSPKERRRMSHTGLLDSAIRVVAQLAASKELSTRSLANRAMADLQKLRHEIPKRRQIDSGVRSR